MDKELDVVDKLLDFAHKRMTVYRLEHDYADAEKVAVNIGIARKYLSIIEEYIEGQPKE